MAPSTAIQLLCTVTAQLFRDQFLKHISEGDEEKGHPYTVAKIPHGILLLLLTHSIIKFFQSRNSEEVLHVHSILNEQFHEVHSIQNQCIQHSLLQRIHLNCRMENMGLYKHR